LRLIFPGWVGAYRKDGQVRRLACRDCPVEQHLGQAQQGTDRTTTPCAWRTACTKMITLSVVHCVNEE
jgi:hypothetical protein